MVGVAVKGDKIAPYANDPFAHTDFDFFFCQSPALFDVQFKEGCKLSTVAARLRQTVGIQSGCD